jgi:hypothetical protein
MARRHKTRRPTRARRTEAEERQTERDKRTTPQQIEVLNDRLGIRMGAQRERARLMQQEWSK